MLSKIKNKKMLNSLLLLFNIVLDVLARTLSKIKKLKIIKQNKEIKDNQIGKKI